MVTWERVLRLMKKLYDYHLVLNNCLLPEAIYPQKAK